MMCAHCKHTETQVIDSRDNGEEVRRRRECLKCKRRFTTYERFGTPVLTVQKKDGNTERFNPDKMKRGIILACKNRPVSSAQIDALVENLEQQLIISGQDAVSSTEIGSLVQKALKQLDHIAFIRFTSVYQQFSDAQQFEDVIHSID